MTHLQAVAGLKTFCKLHPQSLGVAEKDRDMYYAALSLSLRVLLCHYRLCARDAEAWCTCRKSYMAGKKLFPDRKDGDLDEVSKLFDEIDGNASFEPETKVPNAEQKTFDWEEMRVRFCRPSAAFWEVLLC